MCLIFVGKGRRRKLFNGENLVIYGSVCGIVRPIERFGGGGGGGGKEKEFNCVIIKHTTKFYIRSELSCMLYKYADC